MTNVISYNCYPKYEEFYDLYICKRYTQNQLAKKYGTTKKRINKWIIYFNLPLRSKGGGNNRKWESVINADKLLLFVEKGYKTSYIARLFKSNVRTITAYMRKYNIKRKYHTNSFLKYRRNVYRLSEKTYKENKQLINPNNYKRTRCGVENGYQLDHINEIVYCFNKGISIEEASSINNLQFISWQENLRKRKFIKNGVLR